MGNISTLIPGAKLETKLQQEQSMQEASNYRMGLSDVTMLYLSFCRPKRGRAKRVNGERILPILPSEIVFEIFSFSGLTSCISEISRNDLREGTSNENRLDLSVCILKSGKLKLSNLEDSLCDIDLSGLSRFLIQLCRITVDVTSKDQGWSSYPAARGSRSSHTWTEVAVRAKYMQPSSDTNPNNDLCTSGNSGSGCGDSDRRSDGSVHSDSLGHQTISSNRWLASRNIHAGRIWEKQQRHFTRDSDICNYVNEVLAAGVNGTVPLVLQEDTGNAAITPESHLTDLSIQLWARSQYPGWRHFLRHSCMTLEWRIIGPDLWLNADTRVF